MNDFQDLMGSTIETGLESLDKKLNSHLCYGGGGGGSTTTTEIDPDIKAAILPGIQQASADFKAGKYGNVAGTAGVEGALGGAQDAASQLRNVYESQVNVGADIGSLAGRYGEGRQETRDLAQQAITGTGAFDNQAAVQRQLQNLQGSLVGQAAGAGTLGSARGDRAMQSALADQALAFNQARQQQALQGAGMLTGLGQQAIESQLTGAGMQTQAAQGLGTASEADVRSEMLRRELAQERFDAPAKAAGQYFGLLKSAPQGTVQRTSGGGK